jgi:NitT/TauT family transport system substrate-binding protein
MYQVRRRSVGRSSMLALILAVLLASGLLLVAGCGSSSPETTVTAATTTSQATTSSSEPATTTTAAPAKLDKLTLVAPPGPMAIPMAYLKVNNKLAGVADETDLVIWENPDQLKAIVAGKQGDFVTVPSNTAAIFYNKGLELQLLDISVWNITYLVTRDPAAADFTDIKGQSLVVPFQGSVPDVTFQYIAAKEGLDPLTDFDLRYATDPTQAAQLLVSGQVDNAVLSEALATAVLLQTKDAEKPLRKAFAFDKAWEAAAGPGATSPIAGTVATPNVMGRPDVVAAFQREYAAAVDWMLANPEEAGLLVETELPDLGLKAPVMTAALKGITWKYTPALEAKSSLAAFYTALMELSPEVIGGKLPDDGFYYAP